MKSFVNPFIDIILTFPDRSFNLFLTSTCLVLFKVIFLLLFISFSSKYIFFYEISNTSLVAKFAFANLAAKLSAVNLSNS